jgi:hypothetical protein
MASTIKEALLSYAAEQHAGNLLTIDMLVAAVGAGRPEVSDTFSGNKARCMADQRAENGKLSGWLTSHHDCIACFYGRKGVRQQSTICPESDVK